MSDLSRTVTNLPPEQEVIKAKGFHPTGNFVEFKKEEVEQSIPQRFERIVRQFPERIAVKTGEHVVTYAELNAMANRVGQAILQKQGRDPEPIALLFDKGAALMAAMLGVLKVGKFFVLLDPSFPKTRITTILEDSQARLIVTNQHNVSLATDVTSGRCWICEFESINKNIPSDNLCTLVSPNALALIFYTSGSTGQPKGIVWSHQVLLHHVMAVRNAYHVCEKDSVSLLGSGTSSAVTNGFFALLNGAALLPFDVQKEGVTPLASWIAHEKISICWISSPLFRNFCESLTGHERFPELRLIRLMSEMVYRNDVDLYKRYFSPNCLLSNALSSSETGVLRICLLDHNTEISSNEVPVGYSVQDKEVFLLDNDGREVNFDEVGEIVVRSRYLSPGYWRRPDLNEAKFKPDPEGGDKRLYFTGDLGVMFPDGCLVYKGRKDFRVKIRGYGVEIGEVEKCLLGHPAVRQAVVVAQQDKSGETRLVGYFTPESQVNSSVSELMGFMKERLPEYMIPSYLMAVDRIPLTPSGKIDRRALPDPGHSRPELDTRFVAPRTIIEHELVQIWGKVLSLECIGIHDNFFDLGGHSLAATRVVSQVIKQFQLEIPLQSLFQSPTVAEMVTVITEYQGKKLGERELKNCLIELESLSDEEAKRLLSDQSRTADEKKRNE